MSRRHFLAWMGLGGPTATIPTAGGVTRRRVLLQESPVAGFQYYRGERVWPALRDGDQLALVREPANPYDPRAVRIDWKEQKLGYVPRTEHVAVAQMLDRGERLEAGIVTGCSFPAARGSAGGYFAEGLAQGHANVEAVYGRAGCWMRNSRRILIVAVYYTPHQPASV